MSVKALILALLATLALVLPASAEITIEDAYVLSPNPAAKNGAAFMVIRNSDAGDDRLIAVASDAAHLVQLHSHTDMGDGVMKMDHAKAGFVIPAGGSHALARGGDHVMLMGLTRPLPEGATISLTLTFEKAGAVTLDIPVDRSRGE